ncbi:very long chain fatty acid elongase 2-like [Onthophagus taurus]|uniref:very long chain fatty acid elongase 2-like n=1 Tax=Onthophagus taurus TaxID=166361 RepID=UPI000C207482|nr:elongation of very long chain fatty acids protein 2-like [Onthophagus taurus]
MSVLLKEAIPLFLQEYLGPPDNRVKNWIFLNSPLWLIGILTVYFITLVGLNKLMEKKEGLKLRGLLTVYNSFQVLYSVYIFKEIITSAYLNNYKLQCTNYDPNPTPLNMRMATAFWYFYVSKIIDLCDTVFFVLRKKRNQLTFLHIYHHSTMIFNWYLGTLYSPGGQAFLSVMFNSFIHIIMYLYYLLAAIGPHMQKYLWWKKYLTQIQLLQFIVVMVHILVGYRNNCKASNWLSWFTVIYLWTLVVLFANFYYQAYRKKSVMPSETDIDESTTKKVDFKAGGDFKID